MPDLTEVISAAVESATDGGAETTETTTSAPESDSSPDTSAATVDDPAAVPAAPPELSETDKLLEAEGFRRAATGQRENRIPYSRVRKIIDNELKRRAEAHQGELKSHTEKLTAAEQRLERLNLLEAADRLSVEQPERFMQYLAEANPAYKRYLEGKVAAAEEKAATAKAADPEPQPDAQFPDGSLGYSPEQHKKLLDWRDRQVEERVTSKLLNDVAKRFGPIEQKWRAEETVARQLPVVRNKIAQAKEVWGELFTKHESDILKALQADTQTPFEVVVQRVLVPKMAADRTAMRSDLLKEINERPAAAHRSSPAAATIVAASGTRSIEDTIRESIQGLK